MNEADLFKVKSLSSKEVFNLFDTRELFFKSKNQRPKSFKSLNGKTYRAIQLRYSDIPKDGDIYFTTTVGGYTGHILVLDKEPNKTSRMVYGVEDRFYAYYATRILNKKRLG